MWKNNGSGENLKKIYYSKYRVSGLNLDKLLARLNKAGVCIYNVKKKSRQLTFVVKAVDDKKVFAICKELCYNIIKLGNCGKFYPFARLISSIGIVIGVALFVAIQILSSDVLLKIEYLGNGSVYSREVDEYLCANGVTRFCRFSSIDLGVLEDKILADNSRFSFASCERAGCRLKIKLILADGNSGIQNGNVAELRSDVDGMIEDIKVYRGTAVVKVGDAVKAGDLLVGGYAVIKEEILPVNVLAVVNLSVCTDLTIVLDSDNLDERALLLTRESLGEKEIISESVISKESIDGGCVYTVRLTYRRVLIAG